MAKHDLPSRTDVVFVGAGDNALVAAADLLEVAWQALFAAGGGERYGDVDVDQITPRR
jgi:ribulose 1,5-bisphosphate synthetase/thiazole synthase